MLIFFRLELGFENINVQANDPFTKKNLSDLWNPVEFINELHENDFKL